MAIPITLPPANMPARHTTWPEIRRRFRKPAYPGKLLEVVEDPSPAAKGIKAVQSLVRDPQKISPEVFQAIWVEGPKGPASSSGMGCFNSFNLRLNGSIRSYKALNLTRPEDMRQPPGGQLQQDQNEEKIKNPTADSWMVAEVGSWSPHALKSKG